MSSSARWKPCSPRRLFAPRISSAIRSARRSRSPSPRVIRRLCVRSLCWPRAGSAPISTGRFSRGLARSERSQPHTLAAAAGDRRGRARRRYGEDHVAPAPRDRRRRRPSQDRCGAVSRRRAGVRRARKTRAFAGPTKIIFGLDDKIIPAHHAHGLPGGIAVHLFAGIGHMPHFEARDPVADRSRTMSRRASGGDSAQGVSTTRPRIARRANRPSSAAPPRSGLVSIGIGLTSPWRASASSSRNSGSSRRSSLRC